MQINKNQSAAVLPKRQKALNISACAYEIAKIVSHGETPLIARETVLIVVPETHTGEQILTDLSFYLERDSSEAKSIQPFFYADVLPFDALSPTPYVAANRLHTLFRLCKKKPTIVVATVDALMQRFIPPSKFQERILQIVSGQELEQKKLTAFLKRNGYLKGSLVEEVGQMTVHGLVVDLFPPGVDTPVRIEYENDTIVSIRTFDLESQRTLETLSELTILPVGELFVPKDSIEFQKAKENIQCRAQELEIPPREFKPLEEALQSETTWPGIESLQPLLSPCNATFWDYLPPDSPVIICNEIALERTADDFQVLIEEREIQATKEHRLFPISETLYCDVKSTLEKLKARGTYYFDNIDLLSCIYPSESKIPMGIPRRDNKYRSLGRKIESEAFPPREFSFASGIDDEDLEKSPSSDTLQIFPHTKLQTALRASKHQELPFQPLADTIRQFLRDGVDIAVLVGHPSRVRRIQELFHTYEIGIESFPGTFSEWRAETLQTNTKTPSLCLFTGALSEGIFAREERLAIIVDREIFPEIQRPRKTRSSQNVRRFLGTVSQLKPNDYIVHIDHGVGLYRGLRELSVERKLGDFLELEYASETKLFVPVENIGKVQKYIGAEGRKPVLSRLGGKNWSKEKQKVREKIAELAGELLKLYASREIAEGISFGPPNEDDKHFSDGFLFEETPDQQKAIDDVLQDMGAPLPMDRLVCGDVGYGKTEVALRAAFKAVNAGYQVALLVPTTILADQHYKTFSERFAEYPINVACISRFSSPQENKTTIAALSSGKVDVIIGTHRLLQKDISFKNLGLIVIDEEHRFGVAHKEKLKRYRESVDVLTLTATPIPRTLHMSLLGIRDLSVIETPPHNRQVIRTYPATYQASIVREAILRELSRSGQVFYIHNRVSNISLVADEIAELVPEARIGFGHGQMSEKELEAVMHQFLNGEIDVLVSTTIVESGLDIPNANTIIIRESDKFGLAELYQLRGRVGRSSRRAYAYLLISDPATLGIEAKKRLKVLQSLDDLGVGFRLALQDMEIRGAGNLLGKDQSGNITLVGFELYSRILKEAVEELRIRQEKSGGNNGTTEIAIDPEVNIGFPAHIPPFYIPDVAERLLLYQRLVDIQNESEGSELALEIGDRFGQMPHEVIHLVELMVLRGLLRSARIVSATLRNNLLSLAFHPSVEFNPECVLQTISSSGGRFKLSPKMILSIDLSDKKIESPQDLTKALQLVLEALGAHPSALC